MFVKDELVSYKDVVAELAGEIAVLVYYGDKDFICNWMGGLAWTFSIKLSLILFMCSQKTKKIK